MCLMEMKNMKLYEEVKEEIEKWVEFKIVGKTCYYEITIVRDF